MLDVKRGWQVVETALELLRSIAYDVRVIRIVAEGHTTEYAKTEAAKQVEKL